MKISKYHLGHMFVLALITKITNVVHFFLNVSFVTINWKQGEIAYFTIYSCLKSIQKLIKYLSCTYDISWQIKKTALYLMTGILSSKHDWNGSKKVWKKSNIKCFFRQYTYYLKQVGEIFFWLMTAYFTFLHTVWPIVPIST